MPVAMSSLGLVTKSTAPRSSARRVMSLPFSVSVETISTGIGRRRIRRSRKSRPSIFGISTSSVSTSGLAARISSRAAIGSGAAPTTVMSRCALMISVSSLRMRAESSTTTTRMRRGVPDGLAEELNLASLFHLAQARAVLALALEDGVVLDLDEALHPHLPGGGKVVDLARVVVHQLARHDRDALGLEELDREIGVALSDGRLGQRLHDVAAAEELRLQVAAARAALEHLVDQHFHREHAVARGVAVARV